MIRSVVQLERIDYQTPRSVFNMLEMYCTYGHGWMSNLSRKWIIISWIQDLRKDPAFTASTKYMDIFPLPLTSTIPLGVKKNEGLSLTS